MPAASISLSAHAKINLALSVGPPAPPRGYHPIASWFAAIDLHDTVRLTRLPDSAESRHEIRWATGADGQPAPRPTPIDWPVDKDLAVRAHRQLELHVERPLPVHLELIKRTPVGGGLGGGSSDAAAMLLGLNQLFNLNLAPPELGDLSKPLGSDIAFFIDARSAEPTTSANTDDPPAPQFPRPALITGFGDRVQRTAAPSMTDLLLLLPPFGCPTGSVYQAFDQIAASPVDESRVRSLIDHSGPASHIDPTSLFNDLAEAACLVEPRLRAMLDRLCGLSPHIAHVTGSGSTMFVIPDPKAPISLDELAAHAESLVPELVIVRATTM